MNAVLLSRTAVLAAVVWMATVSAGRLRRIPTSGTKPARNPSVSTSSATASPTRSTTVAGRACQESRPCARLGAARGPRRAPCNGFGSIPKMAFSSRHSAITREALTKYQWDVLCLQPFDRRDSTWPSLFSPSCFLCLPPRTNVKTLAPPCARTCDAKCGRTFRFSRKHL